MAKTLSTDPLELTRLIPNPKYEITESRRNRVTALQVTTYVKQNVTTYSGEQKPLQSPLRQTKQHLVIPHQMSPPNERKTQTRRTQVQRVPTSTKTLIAGTHRKGIYRTRTNGSNTQPNESIEHNPPIIVENGRHRVTRNPTQH